MARLPRLALAGQVHHIIQRGNGQQPIAQDDHDCQRWLDILGAQALAHGVALHAYVLMPDHFHLLLTPQADDALPRMMQALGRGYVRAFNDRHQRRGTLWEGRYRATVLDAPHYLLPSMALLDLNPVRAGLVRQPQDYRWSSHRHYAGLEVSGLLRPHPLLWALGNTPFAREAAYAALIEQGLGESLRTTLVAAALQGWALGDPAFVASLQAQTDRRLSKARVGRPRAVESDG